MLAIATELAGKFTPRDYAALTPLIWEHVNPYGRFDLDMAAGDTTARSTPTDPNDGAA